jgi:hypothetical protein
VIDHEPRFVAEASRSEARMITVARDHQDVDAVGDCLHHFAFDAPTPAERRRVWTAETSGCRGKQIRGFVAGDSVVRTGRSTSCAAATEQTDGRSVSRFGDIRRRDVQQCVLGFRRERGERRVDTTLPRSFDDPDHDAHGHH